MRRLDQAHAALDAGAAPSGEHAGWLAHRKTIGLFVILVTSFNEVLLKFSSNKPLSMGGRHEEFSRSPACSGFGSGRCYPGHPASECSDADFARLLWRYLLAVPGFFFAFALPLVLDDNEQALAYVDFVDELGQRTM